MDLPLSNITNHKNAQTNITRTINGGKGTQTWPLINVQTKTQSHSTNKVGTEYGPTHVLTKTQLQQISLRTNNCVGGTEYGVTPV